MKFIIDGARAGLCMGAILTGWSFVVVSWAMADAPEVAGFLYVAVAFGLLTSAQIAWGASIGFVIDLWRLSLRRGPLGLLSARVEEDPEADRFATALLLAAPLLAAIVGIAVGGAHFVVTSKFVRVGFQAAGLLLVAGGGFFAAVLLAPLVLAGTHLLARLVPRGRSTSTRRAFFVMVVAGVLGVCAGGVYAASLDVFDRTMLMMALAGVVGTPLLTVAFGRLAVRNVLWVYGLPLAGTLAAAVCAFGAGSWSSATPAMREAVTKHSKLVAFEARFLQRFADRDGDGFAGAFGGADCDDGNDAVYPGAREVPGNGIDENCNGADAELPSGEDHASRGIVQRAIAAGAAAAAVEKLDLPDPPKNVVILLVDTLRYDHLSFAGYDRETSPRMDEVAKDATVFSRAYATSPHTPRSIPAIFLSRYASRTQWKGGTKGAQYNYPKALPENLSVFEVLAEKGHRNIGVSSHFYFDEKRGLQDGFEKWDNDGAGTIAESNEDIASPRTWEKLQPIIDEVAASDKPFTLFVHLFEPHATWLQHDEFPFSGKDKRINNYDSEIAFVDSYVGRIVDKLREKGLWDKTVFVIVSDHGEGFNEHGYFFHGQTLYNEILNVPMIIRVPGWPARTVDTPTSITDLAPTLLDLFGYPIPDAFDGETLEPAMLGQAAPQRPVYAELLPYTSWKEHHKAVVSGTHKFIANYSAGSEELYDLARDPGEKKNIAKDDPEQTARMRELLERFSQMP